MIEQLKYALKGNPVKRTMGLLKRLATLDSKVNKLQARLDFIDRWRTNYRFSAIERLADYLVGAQIAGDYVEFGVYQGTTFAYAYQWLVPYFKDMQFVAVDSFEGLPEPTGLDAENGYTSNFHQGEFACSEEQFISNLKANGVDMNRTQLIKGWFDQTLASENAEKYGVTKIAAAWIDCDLYESTIPVLEFITSRLSTGAVLLFDDWGCFRNQPDYGQQRAINSWLEHNPRIKLHPLFDFSWHGRAFTF